MNRVALLPAIFVALSACGSDGGSTAEPSSADTTAPIATATPPTVTTAEAALSPACDDALGEAEVAITDVMDLFDDAVTVADLDGVDPDEISAVFGVLGEVVGTTCSDEFEAAVSYLITFSHDEGASRSDASASFAMAFIPELCGITDTLTPSAADACATIANS